LLLNEFLHIWQDREPHQLRIVLKLERWSIQQVLQIADPTNRIRFSTIGGYDQNNSYHQHNNWEDIGNHTEPIGPALRLYKLNLTPVKVIDEIENVPFLITLFAFEDGYECFFEGKQNQDELLLQITIPNNVLTAVLLKLSKSIPDIDHLLNKDEALKTWFIFLNKQKVASFYFNETFNDFQENKLRTILDNVESVFSF
jgi:hypothetical protein